MGIMGRSKKNLVDHKGELKLENNDKKVGRWTIISTMSGKACDGFKGLAREVNKVRPGEQLAAGNWIRSLNDNCALHMQADGNLALYNGRYVTWLSNTGGNEGAVFRVTHNGSVRIVSKGGKSLWKANTEGKKVRDVMLEDSCDLVMYNQKNQRVWSVHNRLEDPQKKKNGSTKSSLSSGTLSQKELKKVKKAIKKKEIKRAAQKLEERRERKLEKKKKEVKKAEKKIKRKIDKLMTTDAGWMERRERSL